RPLRPGLGGGDDRPPPFPAARSTGAVTERDTPFMRRYAVLGLVVALVAATVVLGVTEGRSPGALIIGAMAVAVVLAHLAFTTWGPNATPNCFYRRDLW